MNTGSAARIGSGVAERGERIDRACRAVCSSSADERATAGGGDAASGFFHTNGKGLKIWVS
jgi:hypothetical protein